MRIKVPLRVSLFGGGTDSPEFVELCGPGLVLGTAIDVYLEYNPISDSAECPVVHRTGLGQSSALFVAKQFAKQTPTSAADLAWTAWEAERRAGSYVGWQDAAFAAFGGFNMFTFLRHSTLCERVSTSRLAELQAHLLLLFTGAARTRDCERALRKDTARHRHSLELIRRTADEAYRYLTGTVSFASFGALMHGAWQAKRATGASNAYIDKMYKIGTDAGAWGGKLLGAGDGGYLLFVVPPEKRTRVIAETGLKELPFNMNALGAYDLQR